MKMNRFNLLLSVVVVFSLAVLPALAQQAPAAAGGPGQRVLAPLAPQPYPLARLRNALQQAGAPALTTDEETQIKTLVTNFRTANKPEAPSTALQSAHREYDNAILNGDSPAATAQATIIVNNQTANALARMKARANFGIAVIKLLRDNKQADLLLKWMGSNGLVQLAMSLIEGPAR